MSVVHGAQTLAVQSCPGGQSVAAWQLPGTHAPPTQICPVPQLASTAQGPQVFALQLCPLLHWALVWQSPVMHEPPAQIRPAPNSLTQRASVVQSPQV